MGKVRFLCCPSRCTQQTSETMKMKVPATAIPARLAKAKCPLLRGEMVVLQDLYASGKSTAPIRRQALDFGLGLHAADQLERSGIQSADELSDANIRIFENKLYVRREHSPSRSR